MYMYIRMAHIFMCAILMFLAFLVSKIFTICRKVNLYFRFDYYAGAF